jgi:hypothetical protein
MTDHKTSKVDELNKTDCPDCPMGGGQSCIVARRYCGDPVIQDMICLEAGVPLLYNCWSCANDAQKVAFVSFGSKQPKCDSITLISQQE